MALEDAVVKNEQTYAELTCGTENVSPFSSGSSSYSNQSYYQTDYDWHHQQQQQQHYHHPEQHQQHQQAHSIQTSQLTDLTPRQYYTSYPDTHEMPTVASYPPFSHPSLHQSGDFYSPIIWPNSQTEYIPTTSLPTTPRLFSGIDVSQHVVVGGQQTGTSVTPQVSMKPKRKRVQSFTQRKAANVRERKRMFHLNEAFDVLRKRLPAFNYEKRLSRIETLRLAMTYISFMKDVSVGEDPKCIKLKPHGLDLGDASHIPGLDGPSSSPGNSDGYELNLSNEYSDSNSNEPLGLQTSVH